jgi:hypothetical protein
MVFDRVDAKADHLCTTLREIGFQTGYSSQLRCADGSEVLWMREENSPVVADPFVEVDAAVSGLCGEIRSNIIDTE